MTEHYYRVTSTVYVKARNKIEAHNKVADFTFMRGSVIAEREVRVDE